MSSLRNSLCVILLSRRDARQRLPVAGMPLGRAACRIAGTRHRAVDV